MRFLFAVTSFLLFAGAVHADTATVWQDHQGMVRTRIVAATDDLAAMAPGDRGQPLLAWEAELAPGWKTYWRSPGEAGLPVQLAEAGAEIDILFPVPERFELFGLETYGYSHKVLLPFRLTESGEHGATVAVSFMVCKDICVPLEASYSISPAMLHQTFSPHDIRLEPWLARLPDREGGGGGKLEITGIRVTGPVGKQRLIVDAQADAPLAKADMLAEVNDMVHFGAPQIKLMEDGRKARFVLAAMTGMEPMDLRGTVARLTFSDGHGHAIERLIDIPAN